jgi:ribosomal protein L11 methylase PrmA
LRDGACFIPQELGYWRRDDQGFAGQATRDIEKARAISDAAVHAIDQRDRDVFPLGYAYRLQQRWLYSILARHAAAEPTRLRERFAQIEPRSNAFDRAALSLLAIWPAAWPQLAYAFLRMRPFDLWPAGRRRLGALLTNKRAADLTQADSHYAFGKNWSAYSALIDEGRLAEAVGSVAKLCGDLSGKRFLDIGCGSGLFSAAALRLGAAPLRAIDIDSDSVETTRQTLTRFFPDGPWSCAQRSVFDSSPETDGLHDVVYSWGVLHHTGNMRRAIACAARLVAPGGLLVLGLYRKTPFCRLWTAEKRLYTHGPRWVAVLLRGIYKTAYLAGILATGRDPRAYVRGYQNNRGMDWYHDVEDWLGGYPYESVSNADMARLAAENGFEVRATHERPVPACGLFGSLIVEYTLARPAAMPAPSRPGPV